ncbi:MAG: hypothetical protein RIB53_09895 [Roseitalea porphyridii]|uniref:hypothetical protein n=1 Tax=Roseitalea porphyridii TaxID=1852022 RepID=UPI0032EE430D
MKAPDGGQGEKRREHVRVLKGAHRAAVPGEDLGAGQQAEITGDAQKAGQDRSGQIAVHDHVQPPPVRCDHRRKEDRGEGEKEADGQIERRLLPVGHRHHRDDAADVEDDEQHRQRHDRGRQAQPAQEPYGDEPDHEQFVRRRLVDHEAAQERAQPDGGRRQQSTERAVPVDRREGRGGGRQ